MLDSKKITKISDTKLQEKIGFEPFNAQKKIITSDAKEKVIVCGRRFGKTTISAYMALRELLTTNKKIWVVAPDYELTKKVINQVVEWLTVLFPDKKEFDHRNRPFPQIKLVSGSVIQGKSADNPKSLLGEELDLIVVDEAARIKEDVYKSYLYPTLHDRDGKAIFISTPKGKNWLYEKFIEAKQTGGAFQFPSKIRPSFKEEWWEEAKRQIPEDTFAQEYKAQFVDAAGSVFKESKVKKVINENSYQDVQQGEIYTIGADMAKHRDYTVLTVVRVSTNRVVHFERFQKESYPYIKTRIKTLANRYNGAKVIIDSTGVGEPVFDDLFEEGIFIEDFKFTQSSKKALIDNLRILIEEEALTIPNEEVLIDELTSFEKEYTPGGKIKYHAPESHSIHDDCVDSLALACWGLEPAGGKKKTIIQKELDNMRTEHRRKQISTKFF